MSKPLINELFAASRSNRFRYTDITETPKRKRINWPFIGFWGLYGGVMLALCFWWGRWLLK